MKETDPALVSFEMDIYWVVNGGGDPLRSARSHIPVASRCCT